MAAGGFRRAQDRTGKVSLRTKLIYGLGEMPGSHMNSAIGVLLALYYNQVLGISASTISIGMGLALLLDAISDPVVGSYSDSLKSRLGRRHPDVRSCPAVEYFYHATFCPTIGTG